MNDEIQRVQANAVLVDDGVNIIDETPHTMLVQLRTPTGRITQQNVSKNPRNILLYKHGMAQLVHGEPGLVVQFKDTDVQIQTTDEGGVYVIQTSDAESVHTAPKHERELLEAVRDLKEDRNVNPIKRLHQHILDTQVRRYVLEQVYSVPPFSVLAEKGFVEQTERGWLFHDHLLLTWEGEFRNEGTEDAYMVSGSGVRQVESANEAFTLSTRTGTPGLEEADDDDGEPDRHTAEINGETITFGRLEEEFIAKAVWAVKNVRPRGAATRE